MLEKTMTGYTVHTGSNEKFSSGWDKIFAGKAAVAAKGAKSGTDSTKKAVKGSAKVAKKGAKKKGTKAAKSAKKGK
jgi:hypothetical protein